MRGEKFMTNTMNAYGFVDVDNEGLPDLEKRTIDIPTPKKRQLLVEVKAVSVNPTDLGSASQKKENDDSFMILGRDIAGFVVGKGSDVEFFNEGDEVFYPGTPVVQGAEADYHVIDERMVGLKPTNLSFPEAAALPLTALTSYEVFHDRLQLFNMADNPEDVTLLIVGAAGGVGAVAVQIALDYGFNVVGTASRDESTQYLKDLGVETIINHTEPFSNQLKDKGINKVDAVYLAVKADENMEAAVQAVKPQGRICSLLPLSDALPSKMFSKSIIFSYELMYTRSLYKTDDWVKQHEYLTELKEKVEKGAIKTTMSEHYSEMNEETLTQAYKQLQDGHTVGKIVVEHSK